MRTLVITEHPEFGKVRTVEAGGRVWFCARDVASALGYANPKDAVNRHCRPKGVCVHDLLTAGGRQKVKFIDEGNLYRLMACSRLPSAERFESWIFDELVPRTLKEGGYLLEKEGETDAELLSRTLQLAEAKLKERDRYISGLEKENALNNLKLNLQAPKVHYFDQVLRSSSTYTATQIAKELGMSMYDVVTLASVIEKEARVSDDFYRVSAVFSNRMKASMNLDSDATLEYVLKTGSLHLTEEQLATPSGYNTHTNSGLPLGPVSNPGDTAIKAALYPNSEYIADNYLYFCLMDPDSGALIFAKTLAEHNRNVARYSPLW